MASRLLRMRIRLALGLTIFVGAGASSAQDRGTAEAGAPIVVNGTRLTREEARERAASFVQQIGVARGETPAARWADPVCPRVAGLADQYAGIVEARMRLVAQRAGMRLGSAGCRANITVRFVSDAVAVMHEIDRRAPTRLQEVPATERDALVSGNAPIRWWYATEYRGRHGMRSTTQTLNTDGGGGGPSMPIQVEAIAQYDSSTLSTQVNRALVGASVVIDVNRVEGQPLVGVAAYAALVAFAEVRPSEQPPANSILGLFGAETGATALTDWDMAFLRALYNLPLDREARRHRGMLVRDMVSFQTGG